MRSSPTGGGAGAYHSRPRTRPGSGPRVSTPTTRFVIDLALLGLILLMLSPRATGLPVHEWLGLALGIPVLMHLLLSWTWISRATLVVPFRSGWRHRINYILNSLLFALIVTEIVSGVAISVVALPSLGIPTIEDRAWRALHNRLLNVLVLLVGIHLAMNWTGLRAELGRRLRKDRGW